jgi:hypothetical protein
MPSSNNVLTRIGTFVVNNLIPSRTPQQGPPIPKFINPKNLPLNEYWPWVNQGGGGGGGSLVLTVTVLNNTTGAAISGATITISGATVSTVTQTTNAQGQTVFSGLSAGAYAVSATASGFAINSITPTITATQTAYIFLTPVTQL